MLAMAGVMTYRCDEEIDLPAATDVDFAGLWTNDNEDIGEDDEEDGWDDGDQPLLTPRQAFKLYSVAVELAYDIENADDAFERDMIATQLPPCARSFFRKREWKQAFAQCFKRIAARLGQGEDPHPNCTGEEMALHMMFARVQGIMGIGEFDEEAEHLPESDRDDDWDTARDCAVQDEDVLELFDPGMSKAIIADGPGKQIADFAHLHPADWFIAFKPELMTDHLPYQQRLQMRQDQQQQNQGQQDPDQQDQQEAAVAAEAGPSRVPAEQGQEQAVSAAQRAGGKKRRGGDNSTAGDVPAPAAPAAMGQEGGGAAKRVKPAALLQGGGAGPAGGAGTEAAAVQAAAQAAVAGVQEVAQTAIQAIQRAAAVALSAIEGRTGG